MLLVADPAIMAVLGTEAVFRGVPFLLEEKRLLGLDSLDIVGMDAGAPELGIFQIFLRAITEQPLDVLADEGRGVVVLGLEGIDHRRRRLEQDREPVAGVILGRLSRLARGNVAPRADDFGGLARLVADEVLIVVHPAIGAILAAEAIFDRLPVSLKEGSNLGLDARKVLGVNPFAPEVRIFEIFAGTIAKQALNIV